MEQGGENLRNRGVTSKDRISELPEPLILQILSSLPTKLVISTSVLSKRWCSLWKMVPRLEFESSGNIQKFAENVSKSLISHKASVLDSLHLKVTDRCEDVYVGIWATVAITRHVRELELNLYFLSGKPVRFPSSLFCFDTLETLKLKSHILLDFPCLVSMKSLRTLHLLDVVYKDDESVRNLFSSCPNLEHLIVHRGFHHNVVVNFVIEAPSLKTFSLYDRIGGVKNGGYVINAPCLKYLNIEWLKNQEFCLIENASELVEANFRNVSHIANDQMILGSLKSAKRVSLDLSPLEITFPTGTIFYQLVCLEMLLCHPLQLLNLIHKAFFFSFLRIMQHISYKSIHNSFQIFHGLFLSLFFHWIRPFESDL